MSAGGKGRGEGGRGGKADDDADTFNACKLPPLLIGVNSLEMQYLMFCPSLIM